jgi:hypothetical protein
MSVQKTIVLVLKSGGDFEFRDVELISNHINNKWKDVIKPRIICLWDKASRSYNLGNIEIIPLTNDYPGTWSRMQLYSPEMEKYRPFLYVDLDTAIINSLENIFDLIKDPTQLIVLEDFWQKNQIATGLVWFPSSSNKIRDVWNAWQESTKAFGFRMDPFLRTRLGKTIFWQQLTNTIHDFKPRPSRLLTQLPDNADLICFHGKPRIFEAAKTIEWVKSYTEQTAVPTRKSNFKGKKVTVIIPYNRDRGWLQAAVASVPKSVQLLLSKGDGCWPENFNRALKQATGDYIKYLHEDDMLTENSIEDSVNAIDSQNVDFIHGNALQLSAASGKSIRWRSPVQNPSLIQLMQKNTIHSATLMYKRSLFDKVGLFNESDKVRSFEEYEFNLRCLKAGMKIGYCNSYLAYYRIHPNQLIRVTCKKIRDENRREVIREFI